MSRPTADDRCPRCDIPDLFTVVCTTGPHHARTGCRSCGRHIRWEPAPMTRDRAEGFELPFGRHRGERLGDVLHSDPGYVEWAARELDGAAGRAAALLIGQGPGGRHA